MLVYFKDRKNNGKLAVIDAALDNHEDAILAVQEQLVGDGVGYDMPVLALIQGGGNG